jgi:hypothetical protein
MSGNTGKNVKIIPLVGQTVSGKVTRILLPSNPVFSPFPFTLSEAAGKATSLRLLHHF